MGTHDGWIAAAVEEARRSDCCKSKRGVVIADPHTGEILVTAHNSKPPPLSCSGSAACRAECRRVAVHAEERALLRLARLRICPIGGVLLHVKVVDGELVGGGPPSCLQCSRLILEAEISTVWLYEVNTEPGFAGNAWVARSALQFHLDTMLKPRAERGMN